MVNICVNHKVIKNVSSILFDKDGTIIDSNLYWGEIIKRRSREIIRYYNLKGEIFEGICAALGFDINSELLLKEGPIAIYSRAKVISILCIYLDEIKIKHTEKEIIDIFTTVHKEFQGEMLKYIKILPFVKEFMEALKGKYVKIAIVTSDTEINSKKIVEHLNLTSLVDVIVGKDTIPYEKSTGIPAIEALKLLNENNFNAICIGDTITDIAMAEKSGCLAAIAVATGQISEKELRNDTKYVIKNLGEIVVY